MKPNAAMLETLFVIATENESVRASLILKKKAPKLYGVK
ncbi:putative restriction enzyme fragment 1 [Helicobacter acinonychis str. Sheeba]|uniref:Restriction enzyme 1 n=1 Tax=Helicobacter acinonychis (strain Sheeba) TaxID=382638 RepID=Q17Z90_HELAH|nr:putative restriction enzyme fragment 1 [Helicobacter acinonychis str. Sheeba]